MDRIKNKDNRHKYCKLKATNYIKLLDIWVCDIHYKELMETTFL